VIHINEIDNDGRGPNVYEISEDEHYITIVSKNTADELIEYYRLKGIDFQVYTVDEYYRLEA
jgi:hypothetical protein